MKMQDYYKSVVRSLRDNGKEITKLTREMNDLMTDIKSEKYSVGYINSDLMPKYELMKARVSGLKSAALADVHRLTDAKKAEISDESQIRGEDLTDDAKLFSCGIPLTEQDIRHIVKRNSGNRTMINLAAKYAKQNNMNTPDLYDLADHSEELESCETVNSLAARYCDQWLGNDQGFRQLDVYFDMPKGTAESL